MFQTQNLQLNQNSSSVNNKPKEYIIIIRKIYIGEPNTKILCIKFDHEDKYIACGISLKNL